MTPDLDFQLAARRRARRLACVLVLALATAVGAKLHGHVVATWLGGRTDLMGHPRYEPAFPVEPETLQSIDLARVHGALLPRYLIAASRLGREEDAAVEARSALLALRDEAGRDRNLDALLVELDGAVLDGSLVRDPARALYLVWAWSTYLDRAGLPWWVEGNVLFRPGGSFLYTKTYRVHRELRVAVGPSRYRVRLIGRVDHTNVRERYLGHASRYSDGALVVVDRVEEFALERLMPVLGPGGPGECDPGPPELAAHVADELYQALTADNIRVLESYVTARCSPSAGELEQVSPARRDAARCALVAWAHRIPVIHEVRHVADDHRAAGRDRPLHCPQCPEGFDISTRLELSAYLASFAAVGTGHGALLQACAVDLSDDTPHARALSYLLPRLLPGGCEGPVPGDLYARAGAVERELLGRSEEIALPAGFPRCVRGWRYAEPEEVL